MAKDESTNVDAVTARCSYSGCPVLFAVIANLLLVHAQPATGMPGDMPGERIRERIRQKAMPVRGNSPPQSPAHRPPVQKGAPASLRIAGLDVALWKPPQSSLPAPLVVFSHGLYGNNQQSSFLMQALADAGYMVVAPNHRDARGGSGKPEVPVRDPNKWTESTFKDRSDDIARLLDALRKDEAWKGQIDWSGIALAGHSLGGYTALSLAGAWPSRKMDGVKAVIALSPYTHPFVLKGDLGSIAVPVMYQGGTLDLGVTPNLKKPGGAFSKTSSPAHFVEFDRAGHFVWTNLNRNPEQKQAIGAYCVTFLDRYLKGAVGDHLNKRLPGVSDLRIK